MQFVINTLVEETEQFSNVPTLSSVSFFAEKISPLICTSLSTLSTSLVADSDTTSNSACTSESTSSSATLSNSITEDKEPPKLASSVILGNNTAHISPY